MIKVKIQTDSKRRYTLPVPYGILHLLGSVLFSKILWRQLNKVMNHYFEKSNFSFDTLDPVNLRKMIGPIIKELQDKKGLTLVDIQLEDGTYVVIIL